MTRPIAGCCIFYPCFLQNWRGVIRTHRNVITCKLVSYFSHITHKLVHFGCQYAGLVWQMECCIILWKLPSNHALLSPNVWTSTNVKISKWCYPSSSSSLNHWIWGQNYVILLQNIALSQAAFVSWTLSDNSQPKLCFFWASGIVFWCDNLPGRGLISKPLRERRHPNY